MKEKGKVIKISAELYRHLASRAIGYEKPTETIERLIGMRNKGSEVFQGKVVKKSKNIEKEKELNDVKDEKVTE